MDEVYELLGLPTNAPTSSLKEAIQKLIDTKQEKQEIVTALQAKIKQMESNYNNIADGLREGRVRSLVESVQSSTGRFVGKDHVEALQKRATRHVMASTDEERDEITKDMEAICMAYGTETGMSEKINSLLGKRSNTKMTQDEKLHAKAKELVDSGKAKNWEEATSMVAESLANEEIEE